ncbi:hypothetical protein EH199_18705 [Novosphingobium sp. LASN5T]|nr:hypothetical protein EH199_18705 [Novosphingobium sp. LASN5T]
MVQEKAIHYRLVMSIEPIFSAQQLELVKNAPLYAGDRHPAWSVLFGAASAVDFLTRRSLDVVGRSVDLQHEMRNTLDRAVNLTNISDAAAALAELRALGGMTEAGLLVRPLAPSSKRGATPDFEVDADDGSVTVEVHAKHEDCAQTQLRQLLADGSEVPGIERRTEDYGSGTIAFATVELHPGGVPRRGHKFDSVQANVISKLCAVKQGEKQRRHNVPSVLWLDLSYFGPMTHTLLEQTIPIVSGNIGLTSGAIWNAFYGWKGAPILEEGNPRKITMGHDGRFRLTGEAKCYYAAAIICFEKGLVLFENPWADIGLPPKFRRRCERLPWFKIGHSVADWAPNEALSSVNLSERRITALSDDPHW